MKWTEEQNTEFYSLYAMGANYEEIAKAIGKTYSQVKSKVAMEKRKGKLDKLIDRRRKTLKTAPALSLIEVYEDNGVKVRRYETGYARGIVPNQPVWAGGAFA